MHLSKATAAIGVFKLKLHLAELLHVTAGEELSLTYKLGSSDQVT